LEDTKSSQDNGIKKEEYKVYSNEDVEKVFREFLQNFSEKRDKNGKPIPKYMKELEKAIEKAKKDKEKSLRLSITISMADLEKYDPDLANLLKNNPYTILPIFEEVVLDLAKGIDPSLVEQLTLKNKKIRVWITPSKDVIRLRDIGVDYLNKIVTIEGMIIQQTSPFSHVSKVYVICISEGEKGEETYHAYYPPEGEEFYDKVKIPKDSEICNPKHKMKIDESQSIEVDWQKAIIQETPEDVPPGQIPRQLELVFEEDLVDSVRPGDRVRVLGILKLKNELWYSPKANSDFYLKVLGVEQLESSFEETKISEEDEEKIKELAKDPQIVDRIVNSIAPSLYGLRDIKEAIALSLFGGIDYEFEDGTKKRGNIHVLIIGEPATAKSQLALAIRKIAPRVVFANGKGSTGVGLTASVTKEKNSDIWVLNVGAVVLANGGVAVIDEIDKMNKDDRAYLNEAMEQQTVSINKANIHAVLKAKTTIIGFGNPKGGRFDPEIDILDQINLEPTILSRFDLIFTLRETYDEETLKKYEFIIKTRTAITNKDKIDAYLIPGINEKGLIPSDLLKKYIIYARTHIMPKWEDEATKYLVDFVKELTQKSQQLKGLKRLITARQIDGFMRLLEAYAKMRLSDKVTVDDVKRAIDIFKRSLKSLGIDIESENADIDKIMTGVSEEERRIEDIILNIIDDLMVNGGCAKYSDILTEFEKAMEGRNLDSKTITKMLDKALEDLRKRNYIYEPRNNCYKK